MSEYELTEQDVRELRRIRDKVDGMTFADGVDGYNGPTAIVVGPVYTPQQPAAAGRSASLPKGQYQYMNYQMVSQNQAGFDFVRAHPLVG